VIECISDKNPFVVEDRLQARLLAVREARYKMCSTQFGDRAGAVV
jgi:hypothetical protein